MVRYRVKKTHNVEQGNLTTQTLFLRFMIYLPYYSIFLTIRMRFSSYSEMLVYLTSKYIHRFKMLANAKKSSKKKYQIVCNNYKDKTVRVSQDVHQILKDISDITGYSISYIIRLLIEWEYYGEFSREVVLRRIPLRERNPLYVTTVLEIKIDHRYYRARELVEEIIKIKC